MLHVVKGTVSLVAVLLLTAFVPASLDSDITPMQQMYIMKDVKPDLERVGIIWNKSDANEETLTSIRRAGTSLQVQLFLAEISELSELAPQFRNMIRTHKVQAVWIVKNDGLVDSSIGKNFLIENTVKLGLPLFAPSEDWVNDGAFIAMSKKDEGIHLFVNQSAASALSLTIPDKYAERTRFAAN